MSKNKKIIVALILGIAISSFILVVILQSLKDVQANSKNLLSQKKELVLLENKIKDLQGFKEEYKTKKTELEKINNLFVDPENPVDFIIFLNFLRKTAADSEIEISISNPSQKGGKEPWSSLVFQISGKGKFINTIKFLEKLKNSPYLLDISNISIIVERDEKNPSETKINTNISLTAFTITK